MKYFTGSYIFTIAGLIVAALWAHAMHPGSELSALFIVLTLSVLEVSLSFDNAVINATKLEKLPPVWQHRFLTWGILIAVFGMRFLFPVLVVSIFAHVGLLDVMNMAIKDADKYAHYLQISHPPIITFGGAFLLMLFLSYFFNHKKEIHWIKPFEKPMALIGHFDSIEVIITLLVIFFTQHFVDVSIKHQVITAGMWGIIIYLFVDGFSKFLEEKAPKSDCCNAGGIFKNTCLVSFLYLELIDASFSLDGVLGAFALSKDIIIITIGLSIGAMFVRSLTIMLVEKKTLKQYIYLEHGAHWAIGALAAIMFVSSFKEVSEVITGLVGLVFITFSFITSLRHKSEQ